MAIIREDRKCQIKWEKARIKYPTKMHIKHGKEGGERRKLGLEKKKDQENKHEKDNKK